MDASTTGCAAAGLALLYVIYRRFTRISIADVPGPAPESFLLGNLRELFQEQAGESDFLWQKEFGDCLRIKGALGEDGLLISDPKAIQYIFQTSGYNFPKWHERREFSRMFNGRSLTWAEGSTHKRQRKVMLPAFGAPETKALLPVFQSVAEQMTSKWKDILDVSDSQSVELNVTSYLTRATLDAIGIGAFDYNFGAMEDGNNPVVRAYSNLLVDTFGRPSALRIFAQGIMHHVPSPILTKIFDNLNSPSVGRVREMTRMLGKLGKQLVDEKSGALSLGGKGSRDVMSLLVRANVAEDDRVKLSEDEMLSQMRTIMFAGHETITNTMGFILLELARHPEVQARLREEIRATEAAVRARGASTFTNGDLEGMVYTVAVMKEVMRIHPVVPHLFRESTRDDAVPLFKPITTSSGKVLDEVPIPKGMKIIISVAAYNRNKDVWGDDAHAFDPDRWLSNDGDGRKTKAPSLGVYGNLLTFASGLRSCIGWRFAVMEVQAFLIELISNFEFSLTENSKQLRRESCGVMVSTVEGEVEKGGQVPLRIPVVDRD
ncbi:hypothetical protein JAAARDRAFT_158180 [Jaapia argillacea MUCL 33604]|uniref:Cytochrome P450 n=1 Tax=Jaapia argillacea MUCL 33604 TaxID=933084 RepID=A0A067Q0V4_9AGAM|nr:hypothetical protein JAAARDRAFT_158180 [Jaapia argillacea MUCL 33604]